MRNMGLSKGGDPYGNGVFIVSKVAVVMTVAQADLICAAGSFVPLKG